MYSVAVPKLVKGRFAIFATEKLPTLVTPVRPSSR
jgi:hypothetical protein